jgi:hypothetical protein
MRDDDSIGYGHPPKHTRFKKGQSGNPNGRPKGSMNLAAIMKRELSQRVVVTMNGHRKTITKGEAALCQLTNKAASGDPKALLVMVQIERIFGSSPQDQPDDLNLKDRAELARYRAEKERYAKMTMEELKAKLAKVQGLPLE